MMRGYSLEQDFKVLINNPKYSDITILCRDEKNLYGCRAILAARSDVFDGLLYNGMKESYEDQIFFPTINSSEMKIILEYIYTGSINGSSLTKDNIIEVYCIADYFQLPDLQDFITKTLKNILEINFSNYTENYSPELLSKAVDAIMLTEDNILLNLLIEEVATIPLNSIEFGRLSIRALQYLLSYTFEKEIPFVTSEYEVFRYSAILAAKQISNNVYKTIIKQIPTLDQIESSINIENKFITGHQNVINELEPLIKYIDFRRIKDQIDIIEKLKIIPKEVILNIKESNDLYINDIRGIPIYRINASDYAWDESACGSKLIIRENGRVVCASDSCVLHQNVRAKMILENKGIFEWDIIIKKACFYAWVGVCASENFNYETFAGSQSTGWVLGSHGCCCNSGNWIKDYCPSFGDGTKITVHLNMNKRTCSFTVNGIKYPVVSEWNNLPSKLYPVVSVNRSGCFQIQPHRKI
ncbi:hypothetical protein RclHR1_04240004 [Rhizophagus clarus]|uniref:BTB domain-containing protein n=1 Tax=Rhizophagus clarus TaxID=94130 RepID=A0A2Z6RHL5_9GLOM|nr:hypothetical protein RclHR1_04240004 [Rhizophagus clarus]GET03438.1 hypothetical protein GLOIN_2v1474678 [Rhizophagus clarus]